MTVSNLRSEVSRLKGRVIQLENENRLWLGIKADREERIVERDLARALAIIFFNDTKKVNSPGVVSGFLETHPWLEDE